MDCYTCLRDRVCTGVQADTASVCCYIWMLSLCSSSTPSLFRSVREEPTRGWAFICKMNLLTKSSQREKVTGYGPVQRKRSKCCMQKGSDLSCTSFSGDTCWQESRDRSHFFTVHFIRIPNQSHWPFLPLFSSF